MNASKLFNIFRITYKITRNNIQTHVNIIKNKIPLFKYFPTLIIGATIGNTVVIEKPGVKEIKQPKRLTKKCDEIREIDTDTESKDRIDIHKMIEENLKNLEAITTVLVRLLQVALIETSERYRQTLQTQIDLIENGKNIPQDNEYWDCLTAHRVEASLLKEKLDEYRDMVSYVGKTVENIILLQSVVRAENFDSLQYYELKNLVECETRQNKMLEKVLLRTTMNNIVCTNQ